MADAIHSGRGYEGADEYAPVGATRLELPGNPDDTERVEGVSPIRRARFDQFDSDSGELVPAAGVKLDIERWSAERKEFAAESATPVTLAVKLVNYPAWEVRVDGEETGPASPRRTHPKCLMRCAARRITVLRFDFAGRGTAALEARFRFCRRLRCWGLMWVISQEKIRRATRSPGGGA